MMNQGDTFAGTGGPMLKSSKKKNKTGVMSTHDMMEYARETYGKISCKCKEFQSQGVCYCPGKGLDGVAGGRNPNYSEETIEGPFYDVS